MCDGEPVARGHLIALCSICTLLIDVSLRYSAHTNTVSREFRFPLEVRDGDCNARNFLRLSAPLHTIFLKAKYEASSETLDDEWQSNSWMLTA